MALRTKARHSAKLPAPARNGFQAAAEPYKIVDRRSSFGYANTLIESATQTQDRKKVDLVDYDIHRTVSSFGRRTLMSLARTMVWRMPALAASILEQANLAVNPFQPIYLGSDERWGKQAREWLDGFHAVIDVAGWPYNYESYCESLIFNNVVDGDIFTLLTEDASGNARVQQIGAHRVGGRYQTGGTCAVRYEGNKLFIDKVLIDDSLPYTYATAVEWEAPIIDGVILDDLSRAIAYRVYYDPSVSDKYRDISSRNLFPAFLPIIPGQVRNFSLLASSIFDWQDLQEFKRWEMLAQKAFSTKTIVEENETGDVDTSKAVIASPATMDTDGNQTAPTMQKLDGGIYTYFKSNTGSKLTAFNSGDRPGRGTKDFMDATVRDAFRGTEWDVYFSLDPSLGGAPMRTVVDRVNRTLKKRRRMVEMNVRRVDVYALAKAIKSGQLPANNEFWRWTYRPQADITADRRYESQTDIKEYEKGFVNLEDIVAKRSGDWLQRRTQREAEAHDKLTRAKALADEFDISIQEALNELGETGAVSFSMARRDTGEDALTTDDAEDEGKGQNAS